MIELYLPNRDDPRSRSFSSRRLSAGNTESKEFGEDERRLPSLYCNKLESKFLQLRKFPKNITFCILLNL